MLPLTQPPNSVCLLRLSAIGDTCHVVPLLRTLQQAWPSTRFTWIIGQVEAKLMRLLPAVEFITVDKRAGLGALRRLRTTLRGREFDLLHLLMLNAGRVLSRDQLEQQLYSWGREVDSNAVEVHVHHLRRKLGATLIQTVRGVGYTLSRDEAVP